jgi:hypothetical protein
VVRFEKGVVIVDNETIQGPIEIRPGEVILENGLPGIKGPLRLTMNGADGPGSEWAKERAKR